MKPRPVSRITLLLALAGVCLCSLIYPADERPNIVWIIAEDMSCHFGYQGETLIKTPNVDRLAAEGVSFSRAHVTCPVCSPSRSAMITGMYQTTIGAHQHRSYRGEIGFELPEPYRLVPQIFREAGYYVSNARESGAKAKGKTDYNFNTPADLYDGADWSGRAEGQPFFAQFQLHGGKKRGARVPEPVDPADVALPPQYPDDPLVREDWARYLNSVKYVDIEVGRILERLTAENLLQNTVVIFITDHGISHARGKQFLYEEGTRIPFIVWAPGRVEGGIEREDFVAHIDMAATSLFFAGIDIPPTMESRPLFGPFARPRTFVVTARDRCDETVDRIRGIHLGEYLYIENFYWRRPYLQPNAYKDAKPILIRLRELHAAGELNEAQSLVMAQTRPRHELYHLPSDPYQLKNLAGDANHERALRELQTTLRTWIEVTGDKGSVPESTEVYDDAMAVYLKGMRNRPRPDPEHIAVIEANIALMKKWESEGR